MSAHEQAEAPCGHDGSRSRLVLEDREDVVVTVCDECGRALGYEPADSPSQTAGSGRQPAT